VTVSKILSLQAKKSGKYKSRIESWLKDAEKDAEKAEEYLGRKKEKLKEVESKRCKLF
jgi:F0F1-type ATP synthase membrane subunit b/b'